MPPSPVLVAGGTGLVGGALVEAIRGDGAEVLLLVRRAVAAPASGVRPLRVDYAALPALPPAAAAVCALGTTIKAAGSQAAFRSVDHDAVLAFAHAAHAAGVPRFGLVSALGADPRAPNFYSRVKGEVEAALRGIGFAQLVIVRPSLLLGDRDRLGQPARPAERLAIALAQPLAPLIPRRWRPVRAAQVAATLWQALRTGGSGVQVIASAQIAAAPA